ncbi:hypothetical protein VSO92_13670 [Myroides pelagicus]|uniref:hypothetical protein n=1 Tax=Myroides pelagicus TaxID=270914 RepID=UPI002DB6DB72|nr:hypothetical protein [Myroides pelagicus]MEC4115147.1 hypothetical protein [Myroides pelagicus]
MKKFIKNLLAPLALIAMLAVGAFSVNASNNTNKAVGVEKIQEAQTPYTGAEFYLDSDTNTWVLHSSTSNGQCSLTGEGARYELNIPNVGIKEMYGEVPGSGLKSPLYEIVDNN